MINAGKYKKLITIVKTEYNEDGGGFNKTKETVVLVTRAEVKTTKGATLLKSGTDFEEAYTRFTIRFPLAEITREMFVKYNSRLYKIDYVNNIDEKNIELELQAKAVTK